MNKETFPNAINSTPAQKPQINELTQTTYKEPKAGVDLSLLPARRRRMMRRQTRL